MLLDCDAATLTVWINGERKGVMVQPGMSVEPGTVPMAHLEGPFRWVMTLRNASGSIEGPLALPAGA